MRMGSSDRPTSPAEQALNDAIEFYEARVKALGGELDRAFFFSVVKGVEPNACSAGAGFEDAADLVTFLMSYTEGLAKQLGLRVDYVAVEKPIGQG